MCEALSSACPAGDEGAWPARGSRVFNTCPLATLQRRINPNGLQGDMDGRERWEECRGVVWEGEVGGLQRCGVGERGRSGRER